MALEDDRKLGTAHLPHILYDVVYAVYAAPARPPNSHDYAPDHC